MSSLYQSKFLLTDVVKASPYAQTGAKLHHPLEVLGFSTQVFQEMLRSPEFGWKKNVLIFCDSFIRQMQKYIISWKGDGFLTKLFGRFAEVIEQVGKIILAVFPSNYHPCQDSSIYTDADLHHFLKYEVIVFQNFNIFTAVLDTGIRKNLTTPLNLHPSYLLNISEAMASWIFLDIQSQSQKDHHFLKAWEVSSQLVTDFWSW